MPRVARLYLVQDGRLRAVPGGLGGLMISDLWTMRTKLRMLTEAFVPARVDDDETVASFITRRLGPEMLEKAIDPFVVGTLASDPEAADAHCTLPRLTALERRYGSITMGVMINRLLRCRTAHVHQTFSSAPNASNAPCPNRTTREFPRCLYRLGRQARYTNCDQRHFFEIARGFLRILLPFTALLGIVAAMHFYSHYATERGTLEASEQLNVDLAQHMIASDITSAVTDLMFLTEHIQEQELLDRDAPENRRRVGIEFHYRQTPQ